MPAAGYGVAMGNRGGYLSHEEEATILGLTDEEIEFEYSNKKPKRLRIRDIPKKERETYPG